MEQAQEAVTGAGAVLGDARSTSPPGPPPPPSKPAAGCRAKDPWSVQMPAKDSDSRVYVCHVIKHSESAAGCRAKNTSGILCSVVLCRVRVGVDGVTAPVRLC